MASEGPVIAAAIDFGTTFSGYAFLTVHDFKEDPRRCSTFDWNSRIGGHSSCKTPTCVLFDNNKKFHSFGFEAEEKYCSLALDNKHHDWMLFRRFKMQIYKESNLKRRFQLKSDNGLTMDAMTVFSASIRYLKDHLLEECRNQITRILEEDILFVLTVPAIWSDPAKQFMREAGEMAGIEKSHLLIALEPEAASLFCKHVPMERTEDSDAKGLEVFQPGAQYIILDAGGEYVRFGILSLFRTLQCKDANSWRSMQEGGTIDITVHKVEKNGTLKEIHTANGGAWGGTSVDEAFRALLEDLFGKEVMQVFSKNHKYDMFEVFADFEVKKRTITPELKEKIILRIPTSLTDTFRELNKGKEVKSALEDKSKYSGKITLISDKMRMDPETAKGLFTETMDNILYHMRKLMQDQALKDTDFIIMVGGFSESRMLRHKIRTAFPQKKVIIPNESGLSVMKGAAIFGHFPQAIAFRVCKYTYGVQTGADFDEKIHDRSKKYRTSFRKVRCIGLFSKHVEVGSTIEVGRPQVEQIYSVVEAMDEGIEFKVYISNAKNPTYVTDRGCKLLGSLRIAVPGKGLNRRVACCMTFSETELRVEATDKQTGKRVSAFFNLLE